jgi:KaiC/GvpD/RAD55 family RecA-like ATPase
MALSLLRTIEHLGDGSMIAIFGKPGAGRDFFMKRLAWMLSGGRQRL